MNSISRNCFVPNCTTGSGYTNKRNKKSGKPNKSLFAAPKDPLTFKQWQQAIVRPDKVLSPNSAVCEIHFSEEDIIRFYETKVSDGSVHKFKRGKPKLKDGAVPHMSPVSPDSSEIDCKPQFARVYVPTKKPKVLPAPTQCDTVANENDPLSPKVKQEFAEELDAQVPNNTHSIFNGLKNNLGVIITDPLSPNVKQEFDSPVPNNTHSIFDELKNNLGVIITATGNWSGTFVSGMDAVIFAEWDATYSTKKRVVVKRDMSFKVLLEESEIKVDSLGTIITSFEELENLIEVVDSLTVCARVKLIS